jgi:glycosyltransferase involved in cell wall biosynthesis
MTRVAFIIRLFQTRAFYGGGQKFLYKLLSECIDRHFEITVYCHQADVDEYPGIGKIVTIPKPYDFSRMETIESFYDEVRERISGNAYDLVLSDGPSPKVDSILLQVHTVVNTRLRKHAVAKKLFYRLFQPERLERARYEEKWMKQDHRKIVVVSNVLKNDLVKNYGIAEAKIPVIYPGVDLDEFEGVIPRTAQTTKRVFTFGISATFFDRKGALLFLRAMRLLKNRGQECRALMIVRKTTPSRKRWLDLLLRIYGLQGLVEFLPFQKDMRDFYRNIDCLAMPSHEEAFGLVALEAMACKIPAIVSSCSGVTEILPDCYAGLVFDITKNAPDNLADKMYHVMATPPRLSECVGQGYETARRYSWNRTFRDFLKEFRLESGPP